MIDCHTHSSFSTDSITPAEDMIKSAIEKGCAYFAITDHCDKDFPFCKRDYPNVTQLDVPGQLNALCELRDKYKNKIDFAVGIECGYIAEAEAEYNQIISSGDYDIVLNSIHIVEKDDCYFPEFYQNRTKKQAYTAYLDAVLESINTSFSYDVIGHIGYICRKAPFEDKGLYYGDFPEKIDEILSQMIKKDKALEVNTNTKAGGFSPDRSILNRYRQLGGKLLTFGSDAHNLSRICDNYTETVDALKALGFKNFVGFLNRKIKEFPF